MTTVSALTLCCIVKADVDRVAKEQNLPLYLMGVTSAGSYGATNTQATSAIHPNSRFVEAAVMSQILSSANTSLW